LDLPLRIPSSLHPGFHFAASCSSNCLLVDHPWRHSPRQIQRWMLRLCCLVLDCICNGHLW
jgi:hypothetical protein